MGLSWLKLPYAFPGTAQCCDGEYINGTHNENHLCVVLQQLCLCSISKLLVKQLIAVYFEQLKRTFTQLFTKDFFCPCKNLKLKWKGNHPPQSSPALYQHNKTTDMIPRGYLNQVLRTQGKYLLIFWLLCFLTRSNYSLDRNCQETGFDSMDFEHIISWVLHYNCYSEQNLLP